MSENLDKLCERMEAIDKACRASLAHIPTPLQDALTAGLACVRTTRAWQERRAGYVQRGLFDDTPKTPASAPWVSGSKTSLMAAGEISASGRAVATRAAVLALLAKGPKTCEEIERALKQGGSSIRPRLVELRSRGLAYVEGERMTKSRRMAQVNHISAAGLERLTSGEI
jgi:hypothetical protein